MIDRKDERGVALVTVLLAMVLMLILISSMLAVARNEVAISAFHRDSVRALEYAQAGLDEAVRRMEAGRTVIPGFTASIGGGAAHVTIEESGTPGPSSSFQELRSEATVGRATRRLSLLTFIFSDLLPPNIIFGYSLATQGDVAVLGGDLYSWSFVQYKRQPAAGSYTYAAWGIRGVPPNRTPWCYQTPCGSDWRSRWYPGTRRTLREDQRFVDAIADGSQNDPRRNTPIRQVIYFTCSGGNPVGLSAADANAKINASVGWQSGDMTQSNGTLNADTVPLYGCDGDNLPYTYARETFRDEDGTTKSVWFKTIIFDDWFDRYWILDACPPNCPAPGTGSGGYIKRDSTNEVGGFNLVDDPQYGAVPPWPPFDEMVASLNITELQAADRYKTGGGNLSGIRAGCYAPAMTCPGNQSDYAVILLDNGDYHITSSGPQQGYGTLLIDGDLQVDANFEWWGTIIVNGVIDGAGTVTVHGGLIARDAVDANGTINIDGGVSVGSAPLGAVHVLRKAWWER